MFSFLESLVATERHSWSIKVIGLDGYKMKLDVRQELSVPPSIHSFRLGKRPMFTGMKSMKLLTPAHPLNEREELEAPEGEM